MTGLDEMLVTSHLERIAELGPKFLERSSDEYEVFPSFKDVEIDKLWKSMNK